MAASAPTPASQSDVLASAARRCVGGVPAAASEASQSDVFASAVRRCVGGAPPAARRQHTGAPLTRTRRTG